MAHFAELNENNDVIRVINIPNDVLLDLDGVEKEGRGIIYCRSLTGSSNWKQTSINTRNGVHYLPESIEPSGRPPFRHNFAEPGMKYVHSRDIFLQQPPAPWFVVNDNLEWECPQHLGPKTGEPFTHNELVYIGHLVNVSSLYSIAPVLPVDEDILSGVCTTTEFRLADITEITHGHNPHSMYYTNEFGRLWVDYHDHYYIDLDLSPLAVITAVFFKTNYEHSESIAKFYFEQHPQNEAFSIHECFRLIIEWAFAYTELNNQEPMAELAHNILRAVQMPLEVRNELLEKVPPQVVSLFLSDADFYEPFNRSTQTSCPPLFADWIETIRVAFPARNLGDPLNIDIGSLPVDYPRL